MSFNGSGTYIRVTNWQSDATAHVKIRSDRHDQQDDDFATALSQVICKDGQSQPTADLPLNGHRITNAGDPVNATDLANKKYVDSIKSFSTGMNITGADANGRLNFTSTTGANGITWTGADLSWLARLATAQIPGPPIVPATLNRLVLNDKPDGSGTDVVTVNDNGSIVAASTITATAVLNVKAGTGNVHTWWKGPKDEDRMVMYTNAAGYGHGYLRINGDDPASGATKPVFTFQNDGAFISPGSVGATAFYSGQNVSSNGANMIIAWQGNTLYFRPYGEASTTNQATIDNAGSFWSPGNLVCNGLVQSNQNFVSASGNAILAAQGAAVYLRPNGANSTSRQAVMDSGGFFTIQGGIQTRTGLNGSDTGYVYTIHHTGSTQQLRINDTYCGNFAYQCDYRIKKDIKPLGSVWEGIKRLRPVSYTPKAYDIFTDSDEVRWGLIAHEAQVALFPGAASGTKDGKDIQTPDLMALITALARGLQEAMARIEVLEARA